MHLISCSTQVQIEFKCLSHDCVTRVTHHLHIKFFIIFKGMNIYHPRVRLKGSNNGRKIQLKPTLTFRLIRLS